MHEMVEINSEYIDSIGDLHNILKDQSENIKNLTLIIQDQKKELLELKHSQTNTRNILEKVDDKLIQNCNSINNLSRKIEDKNILTAKMQHVAIFLDSKNDLKLSFNYGAKAYIDGLKKSKLSNGDFEMVERFITLDGRELRNICYNKFIEINVDFKNKLIEKMDLELTPSNIKEQKLNDYKSMPLIITTKTSIEINKNYTSDISIPKLVNIIIDTHLERLNRKKEIEIEMALEIND